MQFGILAFTSLLAIVNPLSVIPMFIAMTLAYDGERRKATLRRAIATGFFIMVGFAVLGGLILKFFGITTPAFQIAGGIIFVLGRRTNEVGAQIHPDPSDTP